MRPSSIIEGIILTGIFVLIIGGIIVDMAQPSAYNLVIDENFSRSYNKFNQTYNLTLQMQEKLDATSNVSSGTSDTNLATGAYNILKGVVNLGDILVTMVQEIATTLGLPAYVVTGIIIIILFGVIFAIVKAIFQTNL